MFDLRNSIIGGGGIGGGRSSASLPAPHQVSDSFELRENRVGLELVGNEEETDVLAGSGSETELGAEPSKLSTMPCEQPSCRGNGGRGRSSGEVAPPEAASPPPAAVEVVGSSGWLVTCGLTSVPRYRNSVLGLEVEGGGGGNRRILSERASFVEVERWRRRWRWTSRRESKRARRETVSKGSRMVGRRLREVGAE
jgi:hypothetical protein